MTTTAIPMVLRRPALPNMVCHSACCTLKEQRKSNDVQCVLCGAMIVKGLQWEQGVNDDRNVVSQLTLLSQEEVP